jgi:uncharacterized protein YciI
MEPITDEYMHRMLPTTRQYSVVILKAGPEKDKSGSDKTVWEHGRRNFSLRAEGLLPIVCPVIDDSDICGIGIFNTSMEDASKIMDQDPAVQAGVFTYELHPCRSFPGDKLPE